MTTLLGIPLDDHADGHADFWAALDNEPDAMKRETMLREHFEPAPPPLAGAKVGDEILVTLTGGKPVIRTIVRKLTGRATASGKRISVQQLPAPVFVDHTGAQWLTDGRRRGRASNELARLLAPGDLALVALRDSQDEAADAIGMLFDLVADVYTLDRRQILSLQSALDAALSDLR